MKRHIIVITALLLLIANGAYAQRRKPAKEQKQQEEVVEPQEDPRITQMLAATQQIEFIDSIVVPLAEFMNYIPLSRECGTLSQDSIAGCFANDMGNIRLLTVWQQADSTSYIACSHLYGKEWSTPTPLPGIDPQQACCPYLMPDGVTLYFAQKSEKSIGGYDLFVTRYDAENTTFLKPENMGMPFTSEANDYLYAIDEFQQLGYLVTDRRQPEGKVCVYTFIPDETRKTYSHDTHTEEQIRSRAAINAIADTWTDEKSHKRALQRLIKARQDFATKAIATPLQTDSNSELQRQADVLSRVLDQARRYYATASESDRMTLHDEIMNSEKELESIMLQIKKQNRENISNN